MASSMLSSLRLAGYRLTSTTHTQLFQLQTVRLLHTNLKILEYNVDTSEREELVSLHMEAMERQQQKMQSLSQITEKLNVKQIEENVTSCDADAAAWLLKNYH
ncbi:unnamed protein product [Meganyctiphanes norvegica]|uniref:Uncharacterized protein n=1 Tax=Meganyctiphanes norvegica TaxID=48144 RepID=A0AAV2RIL5_MEGNR